MAENEFVGTKVQATPNPQKEIGIDTNDTLINNIVQSAVNSIVDISALENFTTVSQSRNQIYSLIDSMSQDPILSSYLKTMAEDSVETNDSGQIVWCESSDDKVGKYVSYLIDSLNLDKYMYKWMHSLLKYGDLYVRLYKKSDYEDDDLFKDANEKSKALNETYTKIDDSYGRLTEEELKEFETPTLNEDVKVSVHSPNDHYAHYVEMVENPCEMFELTKFGKTMGYVQAPTLVNNYNQTMSNANLGYFRYKMQKKDVTVYSPTDFVHACLEDNSSRTPEEVNIFLTEEDYNSESNTKTYKVKRGQSLLSDVFKIWRETSLLENSVLLNRITKSAIIRMISVEVGDMPKEQIGAHLQSIKQLMEQKSALNTNESLNEYTNPGPIENNIYIPTHGGVGAITASSIGGDVDPKQLTDLEYFQNKLFGALGAPKQFFGLTDDAAGFSGGSSLAIISSRYGKSVKRLQNTMVQMITDLINLMLIDKGLVSYVNKFTIRMQTPITQEELDRRENKKNRIGVIQDIMGQLVDIPNPVIKLKILKSLLSDAIADPEVITLIQEQITELENETNEESDTNNNDTPIDSNNGEDEKPRVSRIGGDNSSNDLPLFGGDDNNDDTDMLGDEENDLGVGDEDSYLPTFDELGVSDSTDNGGF